jgi:hypothetical protein
MMKTVLLTTFGLLLAGCAAPYTEAPLPEDHPANPAAAGSKLPERSRALDLSVADSVTTRPALAHEHDVGADSAHENHPGGPAAALPAEASIYTCPMHPEVVTDMPGRCPKCNMKLVPKKKEGAQE